MKKFVAISLVVYSIQNSIAWSQSRQMSSVRKLSTEITVNRVETSGFIEALNDLEVGKVRKLPGFTVSQKFVANKITFKICNNDNANICKDGSVQLEEIPKIIYFSSEQWGNLKISLNFFDFISFECQRKSANNLIFPTRTGFQFKVRVEKAGHLSENIFAGIFESKHFVPYSRSWSGEQDLLFTEFGKLLRSDDENYGMHIEAPLEEACLYLTLSHENLLDMDVLLADNIALKVGSCWGAIEKYLHIGDKEYFDNRPSANYSCNKK